jgi:succinate dehydrogenase/fumarate reductase flavoprotein subunit
MRHQTAPSHAAPGVDDIAQVRDRTRARGTDAARTGEMWRELQGLMWDDVGVLRTEDGMRRALARIRAMRADARDAIGHHGDGRFDMELQDVFDLRAALLCAETVALAALQRRESRGAHQREDLPAADPALERNQIVRLDGDGNPVTEWAAVVRADYDLAPVEAAQ